MEAEGEWESHLETLQSDYGKELSKLNQALKKSQKQNQDYKAQVTCYMS